jgi:hypothetical protein
MPRGGRRRGTPGRAYSNRTDLGQNYQMEGGSPASGGMADLAAAAPTTPLVTPDDTPGLTDPTQYPDQPIESGLPMGPGAGPEALMNRDPRAMETQALKKWLPLLNIIGDDPETPDSVRTLVRWIRSS